LLFSQKYTFSITISGICKTSSFLYFILNLNKCANVLNIKLFLLQKCKLSLCKFQLKIFTIFNTETCTVYVSFLKALKFHINIIHNVCRMYFFVIVFYLLKNCFGTRIFQFVQINNDICPRVHCKTNCFFGSSCSS